MHTGQFELKVPYITGHDQPFRALQKLKRSMDRTSGHNCYHPIPSPHAYKVPNSYIDPSNIPKSPCIWDLHGTLGHSDRVISASSHSSQYAARNIRQSLVTDGWKNDDEYGNGETHEFGAAGEMS